MLVRVQVCDTRRKDDLTIFFTDISVPPMSAPTNNCARVRYPREPGTERAFEMSQAPVLAEAVSSQVEAKGEKR